MGCQHKIVVTRLDRQIAHCHRRETTTFELRPFLSTINRNVKAKFGSEKKQIRLHDIFLNDVRVTSNTFRVLRGNYGRPRFPEVSRRKKARSHVPKGRANEIEVGRSRTL